MQCYSRYLMLLDFKGHCKLPLTANRSGNTIGSKHCVICVKREQCRNSRKDLERISEKEVIKRSGVVDQ